MLNAQSVATDSTALSMHHDLWVELACIEMRMEAMNVERPELAADGLRRQRQLEQRSAQLRHAMQCLSE